MRHLIVVLVFFAHLASAQLSEQEYLLDYKEAVQYYAAHDYEAALLKLTPLTTTNYQNTVVPYALYYFSMASLEADKAYQSRATLRSLFQRFPNWDKINEAYYLYGVANFKDHYYAEGLSYLERISAKEFIEPKAGLLEKYIPEIKNIVLLKELNAKFPTEKIIAEVLVNAIQERTYSTKEDLQLSDILTNRFELAGKENTEEETNDLSLERPYDDDIIDFGLLLPFQLDNFDLSAATSENRYVYDIYSGMELASQKLKEEGIANNLFGFDVGRTSSSVQNFLNDPNFKKNDLVFGPLFGRPNKLVEAFTKENRILQVHPISNNSSLVDDSNIRFLAHASNSTLAKKALDFADNSPRAKKISIYYAEARKDSLLAQAYADEALKRGYTIKENKRYINDHTISKNQGLGHVFITGNPNWGAKVVRSLGMALADSSIIATAGSFNLEHDNNSIFAKNIRLIYPGFVDPLRTEVKDFKKAYIAKMHTTPSYYAYLGYDLILFYGRMLKDGKAIFKLNMDENPQMDDLLLSGFDYSNKSTDNQVVPIVKYNRGTFERVN